MAYGSFVKRDDRPDLERAEKVVGAARSSWDAVLAEIDRHTRSTPIWRFYGRNYGWALAFKRRGRSLAALFPDEDRLTVLVVLGDRQADAALADPLLSMSAKEFIASLPRFKEGCWAFVGIADEAIDGEATCADVRRLIAIRAGETGSL